MTNAQNIQPETVEQTVEDTNYVPVVIKSSNLRKRERTGYAFVLPYVIVFCIFSIYPVCKTFYLSFCKYKGGIGKVPEWIGIENYDTVIHDIQLFWEPLLNTVKIWGLNIVLQLGLAFLLTIVFSDVKYKIKGVGVYRVIYYLPNIIAATSLAFLFSTLLDQRYGSFNQMLHSLGALGSNPETWPNWLGSKDLTWISIAVIQAWMWFGNSFIMLMAGVMGISRDYYEAAAIDGAGRWKLFTKITLPLLKPIMLYVGVTSLIGGLQMFDLPQIMINKAASSYPTIRTVIMSLYNFGFGPYSVKNVGRAAAMAYVLFAIILVFSVLQFVLMRNKEEE